MTKHNYERIAEILRIWHDNGTEADKNTIEGIIRSLMVYFKLDNEKFDKDKFLWKATGEYYPDIRG